MNTPDPVLTRQLPLIAKIIADETWLEAERRGHTVTPCDRVVRENVCLVVLRMGQDMRRQVLQEIAAERQARVGVIEVSAAAPCVAA